jgi:hypothetical protein
MAKDNAVPIFDFDSIKLRRGQRPPKGYLALTLTSADFPPDWPANKPYPCGCGCGQALRVGDRMAVRNVRVVGFAPVAPKLAKKSKATSAGK